MKMGPEEDTHTCLHDGGLCVRARQSGVGV